MISILLEIIIIILKNKLKKNNVNHKRKESQLYLSWYC